MSRAFLVFAVVVHYLGLLANGLPAANAEGNANAALLGPSDVSTARLTDADIRIKAALNQETAFEFANMPLSDVANYVSDRHKIPVQFHPAALKDAAIDPATLPITRNLKHIKLRSALNLILREHRLAWVIRDEVLLITTKDAADNMFETHVYDVHELVGGSDLASLIRTIQTVVGPQKSWDDQGGQGVIQGFSNNSICALVVYQTFDAHERIENLLSDLRKLKPDANPK